MMLCFDRYWKKDVELLRIVQTTKLLTHQIENLFVLVAASCHQSCMEIVARHVANAQNLRRV